MSLVATITTAMIRVVQLCQISEASIRKPTPKRNNGTKILFPTKLMRIITGLRFGTNLFIDAPQMKAPKIPSSPAQSASKAETTITVNTTRKPVFGSCVCLKNRCTSHGKTMVMSTTVMTTRAMRVPVVIASV